MSCRSEKNVFGSSRGGLDESSPVSVQVQVASALSLAVALPYLFAECTRVAVWDACAVVHYGMT